MKKLLIIILATFAATTSYAGIDCDKYNTDDNYKKGVGDSLAEITNLKHTSNDDIRTIGETNIEIGIRIKQLKCMSVNLPMPEASGAQNPEQ